MPSLLKSVKIVNIYLIFFICFIFRIIEYLFIRTDRTILGEAFIHKIIGIGILVFLLKKFHYLWSDIGLRKNTALKYIIYGLILGGAAFFIGYGVEFIILTTRYSTPQLSFYISSYALAGNTIMNSGLLFLLICIVGNIINVIMEEGIFRGLFLKIFAENGFLFNKGMLISSLLFGIWHIAAPLREYVDGNMQFSSMLAASAVQIIITGLMGIKMCMLVKITDTLWVAMADHFVNNFIVNVLHVVTLAGVDHLQAVRISVAQTVSFIFVLFLFIYKTRVDNTA